MAIFPSCCQSLLKANRYDMGEKEREKGRRRRGRWRGEGEEGEGEGECWCVCIYIIRESVDSLCRDGADTPMPPYIGNAQTLKN